MPFKKGQSGNPTGRKKGDKNKIPATIKQAVFNAFAAVGGEQYLINMAKSEPKAFLSLVAKIIPLELSNDSGLVVQLVSYKDAQNDKNPE